MNKEWYEKHVAIFVQRVHKTVKKDRHVVMKNFPKGSCGVASLLLAEYFKRLDSDDVFDYVCGWRGDWSHAWLETNDYIIDVTAHQFQDYSDSFVQSKESVWHKEFRIEIRHDADLTTYDARTVIEYTTYYEKLGLIEI